MEKAIHLKRTLGKVPNLGHNCNMELKIECLARPAKTLGKHVSFFFWSDSGLWNFVYTLLTINILLV